MPKYRGRKVLTTRDPQKTSKFYVATDAEAPLAHNQFVVGTAQHPDTRLFQIWLSTNGLDVTCLAACASEQLADELKAKLQAFLKTLGVYDPDACTTFFGELRAEAGGAEPQPFPDDLVHQIGRQILRMVVDRPRRA